MTKNSNPQRICMTKIKTTQEWSDRPVLEAKGASTYRKQFPVPQNFINERTLYPPWEAEVFKNSLKDAPTTSPAPRS